MIDQKKSASSLMGKRQLLAAIPLSYSTIWSLMRRGEFPRSVRIGGRVFWRAAEIAEFIENLPESVFGGETNSGKRQSGDDR